MPMDAVQPTVTSAGARPAAAEYRAYSPLRTSPRNSQVPASRSRSRQAAEQVSSACSRR
ncbi:hypothetical protein [Streptomyces sp. NBC_01615]|uniref:hypothetical protein n=1 Tax=Streptomyces sp. NBC_01615 TaxID=2975898 RepID=UPI00386C650A